MTKFSSKLTKYIASLFAKDLVIMLLALSATVLLFDIVDLIRLSSKYRQVSTTLLLQMALFKNYYTVHKILPFISLLATLKTYSTLHQNLEIAGAYSIGASDTHLIIPTAIILTTYIIIHSLILVPISNECTARYKKIETAIFANSQHSIHPEKTGVWIHQNNISTKWIKNGSAIIHTSKIDPKSRTLSNATVFIFGYQGNFITKVSAPKIDASHAPWTMNEAKITDIKNNTTIEEKVELNVPISFQNLSQGLAAPETINIWKLHSFIQTAQQLGFSITGHLTYFWRIMLKPIFMFVMLLIGYTMIKNRPLNRKISYTLAKILLLCIVIYFINELLIIAMLHQTQNPMISVCTPCALFLISALYIFTHYKWQL
jgi:lipopolysaccharide export system permease protein